MEGFRVLGGEKIQGEARIEGAKNAVLPIMAASLLPDGDVTLTDCPDIRDVHAMGEILGKLGCRCLWDDGALRISSQGLRHWGYHHGRCIWDHSVT